MKTAMPSCAEVTTRHPKRDAKILKLLHRGLSPKEVAFSLKLSSASVVYEVLRKTNTKAYDFRRENACKKLPKFS